MTPNEALLELLARVGARDGAVVFVSAQELRTWPAAAVTAMTAQKLLVKARPASSVVCPGCEQQCVMPVHVPPMQGTMSAAFVICDKRDDINRVPVSTDQLTQWRSDAEVVASFIATGLGLRPRVEPCRESGLLDIGMASGDKRRQRLCLRANGNLDLIVGEQTVPLADVVVYASGVYAIDSVTIRQLVDSATTADPRYTPSHAQRVARTLKTQATYRRWQKAYRELKRHRRDMSDVWYALQLAKQEIAAGRSADTIRKHMKG